MLQLPENNHVQLSHGTKKKNLAAEILELERLEARKDHLLNARDGRETPNSGTTPGSRSVRSRQFTPPPSRARSTRSEPASDADGDEDQARPWKRWFSIFQLVSKLFEPQREIYQCWLGVGILGK